MNLDDLKFCEDDKYASIAKAYNGFTTLDEKGAFLSALSTCYASKESIDSWRDLVKLTSKDTTGVYGVYGLDASSSEGNQGMCLKKFGDWKVKGQLGLKESDVAGPSYAASADQRFNIACGMYFNIAAWLSSLENHGGKCASVVPDKNHDGNQYGSKGLKKFQNCLNKVASPEYFPSILTTYQNKAVPESGSSGHLVSN